MLRLSICRGASASDLLEVRQEIVTDPLHGRTHKAHVLCLKYVAGRLLKYSTESMAGCDTTIPALDSVLSFFGSLPAFLSFGGFEYEI